MVGKRVLISLVTLCISAGCGSSEQPPIEPEKMQAILVDVHLAEARNQQTGKDSTSNPLPKDLKDLAASYNVIYKHHGIDEAEFEKSMKWYRYHPDQLDSVYAKVLSDLSEMEAKAHEGEEK